MQEPLNKHMIGTFRHRLRYSQSHFHHWLYCAPARQEDRSSAQHPPVLADCVLCAVPLLFSLTLTPIGSSNSVTNPNYYPRFMGGAGSRRGI